MYPYGIQMGWSDKAFRDELGKKAPSFFLSIFSYIYIKYVYLILMSVRTERGKQNERNSPRVRCVGSSIIKSRKEKICMFITFLCKVIFFFGVLKKMK